MAVDQQDAAEALPRQAVEQIAQDVATYLAWASDPKMQTRKQMGVSVIAYLAILALLAYVSYRRIWRNVEH